MIMDDQLQSTKKKTGKIVNQVGEFISKNQIIITILFFLYILPLFTRAERSALRTSLLLITEFLIFGIFALSFDLQLARTGLLNFGQAAFFGIGAYITAWHLDPSVIPSPLVQYVFELVPYPLTLVSAIIFGVILGLIMGSTTNRMNRTAFAFIALAIAMLLLEFMNMPENLGISGGETGLLTTTPSLLTNYVVYLVFVALTTIIVLLFFIMVFLDLKERRHFLIVEFSKRTSALSYKDRIEKNNSKIIVTLVISLIFIGCLIILVLPNILDMYFFARDFLFKIPNQYYFVLTITILVYLFIKRMINSPFGRVIAGIAQNEERMSALGYNVFAYKMMSICISGGLAALAGSLFVTFALGIQTASTFGILQTIDVMLYSITGGLGTLLGPFLGTGIIRFSELRLVVFIGDWWLVILGFIFILIILFFPYGIVGSLQLRRTAIKTRLREWFGIRDSDYWWLSLCLIYIAFLIILTV